MNEVNRWILAGAGVPEGLRLLDTYAPNPYLRRIVEAQPAKFRHLLVAKLRPFADGDIPQAAPEPQRPAPRFREQWPFLSEPSCPMELKVLAADKITAYHNACDAHEKLFDCVTPEDCFETAKKVVENFSQNRHISSEFDYYKEHGTILGKHPVFKQAAKMNAYRKMGIAQLVEEKRRLEGAIWRIKSEIAKGDKPHLLSEREARLKAKTEELEAVKRLLA